MVAQAGTWYATTTNRGSAHEQGLIIDEATGANIAVAYDTKHAELLAAAPDLASALMRLSALAGRHIPHLSQMPDYLAAPTALARAGLSEASYPPMTIGPADRDAAYIEHGEEMLAALRIAAERPLTEAERIATKALVEGIEGRKA